MASVTITDVAAHVGVSVATVSRFLSGLYVRQEDEIRNAIIELNYRPSAAARNLKSGRTGTIAIIVPDISNPFFASIVKGAEKAAGDEYMVLLANTDANLKREEKALSKLFGRVDGVILVPHKENEPGPTFFSQFGLPIVFVDRVTKDSDDFDSVLVDNVKGARMAAELFLRHGHTKIAMVGGPVESTPGKLRTKGFKAALKAADVPLAPEYYVESDFSQAGGFAAMNTLLDLATPPTAVFSANNLMTIGVLQALISRKVSIPEEISVIGFDDVELAQLVDPPLTVITRDVELQGAEAMGILLHRLKSPGKVSPQHKMLDVQLIERGSCAAPPSRSSHKPGSIGRKGKSSTS